MVTGFRWQAIAWAVPWLVAMAVHSPAAEAEAWRHDRDYTYSVTLANEMYKGLQGVDINTTVDEIIVYRLYEHHNYLYAIEELLEKDPVFRTRNRSTIDYLLRAVQNEWRPRFSRPPLCGRIFNKFVFHVLALDHDKHRAAYFHVEPCYVKTNGRDELNRSAGSIVQYDDNWFGYESENVISVFRSLGIMK